MSLTLDQFCDTTIRSRLLDREPLTQLRDRWQAEGGGQDPAQFATWLVANNHLTTYQTTRLLKGHADHHFLNQYRLLDRIGVGRMAGVYRGQHRLGQMVAVKVLPPNRAKDPQVMARFQREARLAMRFKHPNLIRTFQSGQDGNLNYLIMEYLEGESLEELLTRRGRLPHAEAVHVLLQALEGLQYLHEEGIVHRDLCPANLMVVPATGNILEATVKITDIGVGRALFDEGDPNEDTQDADLTMKGDLLGSPDYMAPEQARDAHTADVRADIYSLGCVLYRGLTGQVPFPAPNIARKMAGHAVETPPPIQTFDPVLPASLQMILDRMMAKSPAQRFPTPAQVSRALESYLDQPAPKPRKKAIDLDAPSEYEIWLEAEDPEVKEAARLRRENLQRHAHAEPKSDRKKLWLVATIAALAASILVLLATGRSRNTPVPPTPGDTAQNTTTPPAPPETEEAWASRVMTLTPKDQVREVAARLIQKNPGFDGQTTYSDADGAVTDFEFVADRVTDLSPVRVLKGLKVLHCAGSSAGKSKLADLAPLAGTSLTALDCSATQVSDLTPLRNMPLVSISLAGTQVRDLAPLRGLPLLSVNASGTPVRDITPLEGMTLSALDVSDTAVSDFSVIRGMPLSVLWAPIQYRRDSDVLGTIASLQEVNGKPLAELAQQADAEAKNFDGWLKKTRAMPNMASRMKAITAKLREMNPGFDGKVTQKADKKTVTELSFSTDSVSDLSPLKAVPELQRLVAFGSAPGRGRVTSLEPLRGMPLTDLDLGSNQVQDLAPLAGMPLATVNLDNNARLADLSPLATAPITRLSVASTSVADLAPLKEMPLATLAIHGTKVHDLSPLKGRLLKGLSLDYQPARDADLVKSIEGLEKINNKPVADFWKDAETREKEWQNWLSSTAALTGDAQVQAVVKALKERNPGYSGDAEPKLVGGVVEQLKLKGDGLLDLFPIKGMPKLKRLEIDSAGLKAPLADLSPLKGTSLTALIAPNCSIADLSPLEGMNIVELNVSGNPVKDFKPLQKLVLRMLDVSEIEGVDTTPLKTLALRHLKMDVKIDRDVEVVQAIRSLESINGDAIVKDVKPTLTATRSKATPSLRFVGEVSDVDSGSQTITVRVRQTVMVPNYHAAYQIVRHRALLAQAAMVPNPIARARRVEHQVLMIARYAKGLYRSVSTSVTVSVGSDAKVRLPTAPTVVDSGGKVRPPTAAELKTFKGDPTLPGFQAEFASLRNGQAVEVSLAPPERAAAANEGGPLTALMVVILRE